MNNKFIIVLLVLLCTFMELSAQIDSIYTKGWTTNIEERHNSEIHKYLEAVYPYVQKYLKERIKYPIEAQKNNIQGCVSVQYRISSNGAITDILIIEKVDSLLDNEVLTTIKVMPKYLVPEYRIPNKYCFEQDSVIIITRMNFILRGSTYINNRIESVLPKSVCFVSEIDVMGFYTIPRPQLTGKVTAIKKYKWWQFWK